MFNIFKINFQYFELEVIWLNARVLTLKEFRPELVGRIDVDLEFLVVHVVVGHGGPGDDVHHRIGLSIDYPDVIQSDLKV